MYSSLYHRLFQSLAPLLKPPAITHLILLFHKNCPFLFLYGLLILLVPYLFRVSLVSVWSNVYI